jgi:PAS domain S-box-containing protein
VHQRAPRSWAPHEIELVGLVAHRCRESVARARLARSLLRKTLAFSVLADNGTRFLAEEHPHTLIESLFHQASELAGAELCLHHLVTADRTRLQLAAACGVPEGPTAGLREVEIGEQFSGARAATARPVVSSAAGESGDGEWLILQSMGVRVCARFPLAYEGTLLGTLSFGSRRRDAFEPDEIQFLQALSDQVAAAYGRARGARALRESEERLLQAAVIAGLGTFDTDFGTAEMAVNGPGRAIYGWPPEAALTFAAAQAHFHPDDRARVVAVVRDAFDRTGAAAFDVEHRILRTDGAVRWIRVRGRAIFDSVGGEARATRCLGTFVDITDRKEADERRERRLRAEREGREEAERLGRLKDEFLATVSHELRTPLNAILGWSQVLRRRPMAPEDTRNAIEVIDRNARAQAQLIDDLLDMSRFISGNIRLDMHQVDLGLAVTTALESVQPVADAKGVQLHLGLAPGDAMVFGDATRLQQVVWNLLSNAVKFTPAGGRVDVRVARTETGVDITIRDTGEGIVSEFLPHIFEPFRQQDSTPTRRHGGVGLGLSIVKQLVEVHGGDVRATSGGVGLGSTFVVSLPSSEPWPASAPGGGSSAAGAVPEPSEWPARLDGIRVLVVEDEPDALALLVRVLGESGATVTASGSAEHALAGLGGEPVDVLVSDIGMPGMDGYELIRRVRALPDAARAGVPAIAVSAYARTEDGEQALAAGYQRYLAKPVDVPGLIAEIAGLARPAGGRPAA